MLITIGKGKKSYSYGMCVLEDERPFTLRLITSPSLKACLELVNKEAFTKFKTIKRKAKVRSILNHFCSIETYLTAGVLEPWKFHSFSGKSINTSIII